MDSRPVGLFDSGVGGLSVLRQIQRLLPAEDLLYVADNHHLPYGDKSPDFIRERALRISQFLIDQGAKALVVACNTATAAAVAQLRERFPLPIVGMEPGVKPAIEQSRGGRVAILATRGTLGSGRFRDLLQRHAAGAKVIVRPCPGWVELVEQPGTGPTELAQAVERHVAPLLRDGVDTLVLGCTHYPFLKPTIAELAGERVHIIDTGEAVARQLQRVLTESRLLNGRTGPGRIEFWSSAPNPATRFLFTHLWDGPCRLEPLPV